MAIAAVQRPDWQHWYVQEALTAVAIVSLQLICVVCVLGKLFGIAAGVGHSMLGGIYVLHCWPCCVASCMSAA